ncbi:AMP-binding protein [Micromonospora sp. BRA006-A]|nr:AMP-binding protein [Micromonospora sp. BRA006-A]
MLNTCHNALDRHVAAGRGDQPALIHDSPVTGTVRTLTYAGLLAETARFAGALRRLGVGRGDRVLLYLAMVPEAVIAMLACARIGAVHSVVFGGFAAHELAVRIDDARPKVVVATSCGIEADRVVPYHPILAAALDEAAHAPERCAVVQRPQEPAPLVPGRDLTWAEVMADAEPAACERWPPPTRSTSSTPPAPPAGPRAWCGTTAGTRWRCAGRCATSTASSRARSSGPPPTWAGWSATPTSCTRRCSPARRLCSTRASRSAPRTPGRSRGSPPSTGWPRCPPRPPRSGRSAARTPRAATSTGTTCALRTLFLAGERLDPDTWAWAGSGSAYRWSTTGGRRRPAGRWRPTRAAWSRCRSSRGRRRCRFPATTCAWLTARAGTCRPARTARS